MDKEMAAHEGRMTKAVEAFQRDLGSIRAGKASPALLDNIRVDYYGTPTPLKQVASVSAPEPRLLIVQPWEKNLLHAISKAIQTSDLGLNPQDDGNVLKIPIPTLNEERRRELVKMAHKAGPGLVVKSIPGGFLAQTADTHKLVHSETVLRTLRAPTEEEWAALGFAWKVVKHVKSNAIVYARAGQVVGVGAGQMSRVDSVKIGAMKAVLPLDTTVLASDAFVPFPDGVEEVAGVVGADAQLHRHGVVLVLRIAQQGGAAEPWSLPKHCLRPRPRCRWAQGPLRPDWLP